MECHEVTDSLLITIFHLRNNNTWEASLTYKNTYTTTTTKIKNTNTHIHFQIPNFIIRLFLWIPAFVIMTYSYKKLCEKLFINGGTPLTGQINISSAKMQYFLL